MVVIVALLTALAATGWILAAAFHKAARQAALAAEALQDEVNRDPLTGLANRRAWDQAIKRLVTEQAPGAVAVVDVDRFKVYNDTYGHPAGDRLLQALGGILMACVRRGDLVARLGGEEFGILLPYDADETVAAAVLHRIQQEVLRRLGVTVSAGYAVFEGETTSLRAAVVMADEALYAAKERRNRVIMWQPGVRRWRAGMVRSCV